MNFIINLLNKIIIVINRAIDGLNKKTVDRIKSSFYALVFILIVLGIFVGYNRGKDSAKKYGKPLIESTNDVFDFFIKKNRSKEQYRSMLETELIEEKREMQLKKVEFPANEMIKTELENKVIETGIDAKRNPFLSMDSQKMADIDRTDDRIKKSDVRELKKEGTKIRLKDKTIKGDQPIDAGAKIIEK